MKKFVFFFVLQLLLSSTMLAQHMVPEVRNMAAGYGGGLRVGLVVCNEIGGDSVDFQFDHMVDSARVEASLRQQDDYMEFFTKKLTEKGYVVSDSSFCTMYFCFLAPQRINVALYNMEYKYKKEDIPSQEKRWKDAANRMELLIPVLLSGAMPDLTAPYTAASKQQLEQLIESGYPEGLIKVLAPYIGEDLNMRMALDRKVLSISNK